MAVDDESRTGSHVSRPYAPPRPLVGPQLASRTRAASRATLAPHAQQERGQARSGPWGSVAGWRRSASALGSRCPTIRAARGGAHLYLSVPAATRLHNTAGTLAPLVDNRAWGGCVVAGSTVNGHTYAVDGPALINPLPGCLRLALMPPATQSAHPCAR
ncbi:bifunctional DNA primase/polymerase [Streptomyces sp. NPDC017201]|uniref:bifunctional DNA primase/polymerase n=1 Tax=unclassified Streptomyces TaxID=2593676 RepID=UPI0037B95180